MFTAVLQANDVNQWVTADLGAESLVCGVTTQGRGESIHIIGCNKPEHLISWHAYPIVLIAHHQPCLSEGLHDTTLQQMVINGLLSIQSGPLSMA